MLIEVLDERLGLVQLLGIPGGKFDGLAYLLKDVRIMTAGDLLATRFAIRKGFHSDSYWLLPTGSPQEICINQVPQTSRPVELHNQ